MHLCSPGRPAAALPDHLQAPAPCPNCPQAPDAGPGEGAGAAQGPGQGPPLAHPGQAGGAVRGGAVLGGRGGRRTAQPPPQSACSRLIQRKPPPHLLSQTRCPPPHFFSERARRPLLRRCGARWPTLGRCTRMSCCGTWGRRARPARCAQGLGWASGQVAGGSASCNRAILSIAPPADSRVSYCSTPARCTRARRPTSRRSATSCAWTGTRTR